MPNYTLGKDYTVAGLPGVSDLTLTRDAERVDVTTRKNNKPLKLTAAGLQSTSFECTVLATDSTVFTIGKAYSVTLNNEVIALICTGAAREEPQAGTVTYKLTMRIGEESETCDQIDVGPGEWRSC